MESKVSPWLIALVVVLAAMLLIRPGEAAPKKIGEAVQNQEHATSYFIPDKAEASDGHVIVTHGRSAYLLRKFGSSLTQVSKVDLK